MIVDSHHHLWRIGRNGHEWPTPELPAIHRDFEAHDLAHAIAATGVTQTVLVQSQPSDLDTDWMLMVAANDALIHGVVGWVDLATPDAIERITHLSRQPKLKGLRPMLQGLSDDNWILQPAVQPALRAMSDLGLTFDALVFSRHLEAIDQLARTHPALKIVIDHCAKPPIAAGPGPEMQAWRDGLTWVAQNANVLCKLSGLVTEMGDGQTIDAIRPYADHALDSFGPARLMWGSDWPVVLLRQPYDSWLSWTKAWLADKDANTNDLILGGTARHFYNLH